MKSLVSFKNVVISKDQLMNIKGGDGTCAVVHWPSGYGNEERYQSPKIFSKEEAIAIANLNGEGYGWCCDSCL